MVWWTYRGGASEASGATLTDCSNDSSQHMQSKVEPLLASTVRCFRVGRELLESPRRVVGQLNIL